MKIRKFLKESALVQIISTAAELEKAMNELLSSHSLSLMQGLILVSIFFEEGREVRPKELSSTFQTTKGNISHCLSRLEELKLVKRVAEVSDRRGCYVRMSKRGEDIASQLVGYFDKLEARVDSSLSPMKGGDLCSLLTRIVQVAQQQSLSDRGSSLSGGVTYSTEA